MNHETQRLLVAASRGARVQYRSHSNGVWSLAYNVNLLVADGWYRRIHPEDVHLQYGPVATELRRMAGPNAFITAPAWVWHWMREYVGLTAELKIAELKIDEAKWICAFAAELAADEGM